jgi:hypothetical protein
MPEAAPVRRCLPPPRTRRARHRGGPGRTPGGDYTIQRGRLNLYHRLFGQATSRTRRHRTLQPDNKIHLTDRRRRDHDRSGGGPGTSWIQAVPPNVTRRARRPPAVPTAKPMAGVSKRRCISKCSATTSTTQNAPSPGGQVSGMAGISAKPSSVGWLGVASLRPPGGLPRGFPGAGLASSAGGWVGCCLRGAAWSGYARPTGCHTAPSVQDHQWSPGIGKASRHPARHRTGPTWCGLGITRPTRGQNRHTISQLDTDLPAWMDRCHCSTKRPHGVQRR